MTVFSIPQKSTPDKVRLVPGIAIASLINKEHKEIALWHCLKSINYWGSGVLDFNYAIDSLVKVFHYSPKTVYRLIKAGHGRFWEKRSSRIKIYGRYRVGEYFNITSLGSYKEIGVKEFQSSTLRRAWLYSCNHTSDVSPKPRRYKLAVPRSRQYLESSTGVSRVSQWRYDKLCKTRRVAQFEVNEQDGQLMPSMQIVRGKTREYVMDRRLPNAYYSKTVSVKGMLPRISARLRHNSRSFLPEGLATTKRYFNTLKKAIHTGNKSSDSVYRVPVRRRVMHGRQEWCLYPGNC